MKWLKRLSFSFSGILICVLMAATVIEKVYGTAFATTHVYASRSFVVCWGIMAVTGLLYLVKRGLFKRKITGLLHLSFAVILLGALATHLSGKQGMVHLREKETVAAFTGGKAEKYRFPFKLTLERFQIIYYPGTPAPMDYESTVAVTDVNGQVIRGVVAMNQIFSCKGYRFYQSGYDEDELGVTLAISHDPYGIPLTYAGYGLLLLSMILFFITPDSHFRRLIKSPHLPKSILPVLLSAGFSAGLNASNVPAPQVLPQEIAAGFGDLYVLHNNRICPLQTLAKDFTSKLYGKQTCRGLTAEQVFTGWMFYHSSWKEQPVIRIKSNEARHILGIKGTYASLDDFTNQYSEYKLDSIMHQTGLGANIPGKRGIKEADEKYNLLRIFYSGQMMKIFPCRMEGDAAEVKWFSQGDVLPEMEDEQWFFIRKTQDYIHEMVVRKDYEGILAALQKIKAYQRKEAADVLPSQIRFEAEKLYNRSDYAKLPAIICILSGLPAFICYCMLLAFGKSPKRILSASLRILLLAGLVYLTGTICLRWIVSGYFPLSNGYETMQFTAWSSLLTAFFMRKRLLFLPFGLLVAGLALFVSTAGESNPQLTQLMPVLSSPLLSIHVVVIMLAYVLFAFMMLNGIAAFIIYLTGDASGRIHIERLQTVSRIILYPALCCLTAGIFVGAVWANITWGRYWGWDPKEVWALVTLLTYALALHSDSLAWFRRPMFFHCYAVIAFLTVLITCLGVNHILGGMHSYA
ncbi:MAG: cytochrome c biogenesis protein CcsA [Tannerella sp.]|nr:cytochrome c biogenesis protein CcsA [Tannerella sp.]